MVLELWGSGFNAYSQLLFDDDPFPDDILTPTLLATAKVSLEPLFIGWSDLGLAIDGTPHWRGSSKHREHTTGAIAGNQEGIIEATSVTHLARNGTDRIARVDVCAPSTVRITRGEEVVVHRIDTRGISQLATNETCFTVLTEEGRVFTWGDARGVHSLGREPAADEPADVPGVVGALDGLVVTKIASGGGMSAALAESGDIYIWGAGNVEGLEGVPAEVGLVDLPVGEVNVVDVAVGAGHMLVLTEEGEAWAAGENGNGQLGGEAGGQSGWRRWKGSWNGQVRRVFSGPFAWCSLVLVERGDHEEE